MKKLNYFLVCIGLFLGNTLWAQRINQPPTPTAPSIISRPTFTGWFDKSKWDMHQSYSMSISSFGSGQNFTEGLYTNTLTYHFDAPAVMRLDIGLIHDPFGTQQFGNKSNNAQLFLKNISFDYKPTPNSVLSVGFRQIPFSMNSFYNLERSFYRPAFSDDYFNSYGW